MTTLRGFNCCFILSNILTDEVLYCYFLNFVFKGLIDYFYKQVTANVTTMDSA